MDSYGAVFASVPAGGAGALEAAILEARKVSRHSSPLGVLQFVPTEHGVALVDRWGKQDNMPIWAEGPDLGKAFELAELSKAVGEVVAFYEIDGGMMMGIYGAWRNGVLVRDIEWNDGSWYKVEGEPQPWEQGMFGEESFAFSLDFALEAGLGEGELREIFAKKQLVPDARFPIPQRIALGIKTFMKGPAFGFQPWPKRRELVEKLPR